MLCVCELLPTLFDSVSPALPCLAALSLCLIFLLFSSHFVICSTKYIHNTLTMIPMQNCVACKLYYMPWLGWVSLWFCYIFSHSLASIYLLRHIKRLHLILLISCMRQIKSGEKSTNSNITNRTSNETAHTRHAWMCHDSWMCMCRLVFSCFDETISQFFPFPFFRIAANECFIFST